MSLLTWKLKRELHRIRQQLRSVPEFFAEPLQRRRHDARRSAMVDAEQGQVVQCPKVALLLVYQPKGISDATVWTCQHLVNKGYAPLVISNAPLSADDKSRLHPWIWRMAERPNFGYDFGGYRDGIWLLSQWRTNPDTLIILNDSIWFPLHGNETLIDRMEASEADFVGALQLDPLRQTDNIPARKRPFFGSFFLMVKRGALQHAAFTGFWNRYQITSNKYKTIRRGERGFSHALMDAGIRSEAIYTRSALDHHIETLSNQQLKLLLGDLVSIDARIEMEISQCIRHFAETAEWRTRSQAVALAATEKQNILATAPITSLATFDVPYLKKSKDWNNLKALTLIRERFRSGHFFKVHPSILKDIDDVLR